MGNETKPTTNPSDCSPATETVSPCESTIRRRIVRTQHQLKGVDLTGGVLTLLVGALVYLLAAAVIDHWLVDGGLGFWGRWGLCLLFWIGVGVVFVRQLLPSLRWRIHPLYAASTLEQSRPSLKNSLINFLLLRGHRREIAAPIYQAVEQRAAADLSGIESDAAVDRTSVVRLGAALAVVLAMFAIYLVVSPKNPLRSAARVLWPWADVAAPTRVTIREVQPGNVVAFYGDRINVSAEIVGLGDAESPQLFYSTADGQMVEQSVPMTRPEGEYRYQCDLPPDPSGLQQSCQYWIAVDDARSRRYQVSVQPAPAVEIDRVDYHYPPHLGLPDRTVPRQGDLRAVEGTEVTIHAKANVDVKPGTAEIDLGCTGHHGLRMTTTGGEAVGRFTLRLKTPEPNENLRVPTAEYNAYQIRFADLQGRENPRPVRYQIEVLPDLSEPQMAASQPKNAETSADRREPEQNAGDRARGGENRSATGSTEPKSADGGRGGQTADRSQTPSPNASDASPSASSRPSEPQKLAAQTDQRPDPRIDPDSNPADAIQEILNDRQQQQGASKGDTSDQSSAKQPPSGSSPSSQQPSAGGEQKSGGNEPSGQSQPQSGGEKSGQSQPQPGSEKSDQSQPQSGSEKSGGGEKSGSSQKQNQGSASGDQEASQRSSSSQASSDAQRQAGGSGSDQQKSAAPPSSDGNREKPESAASESKDQQGRDSQSGKDERQPSDRAGGQGNQGPSSGASKENAPQSGGASAEQKSASGAHGGSQKSGDAKSDGQKSEGPKTDGGRGDGPPTNGENRGDRPPSEKLGSAQNGGSEKATSKQPSGEKSGEKSEAQATDGSRTGDQPSGVKTLEPSRADSAERKQPGLPQAGDQPKPEKGQGLENPAVPSQPQGDGSPSQGQPMPFQKPKSGSSGQTSSEGADRNSAAATDKDNVEGFGKGSVDMPIGTPTKVQKSADQQPDSNLPPETSNRLDSQKRSGAGEGKTPPSDAHPGEVSSEEPSGPSTNRPAEFDVANPQGKGSRPTDRPVAEDLKSGGRPGKPSNEKPPHEPTDAVADRANLEYARRQTELALEYLRDQLQQEKPKLLERLG
ncbi:MAG: hypothetical protein ABFC54_08785, partial [Thermoguttaceae bacterium]